MLQFFRVYTILIVGYDCLRNIILKLYEIAENNSTVTGKITRLLNSIQKKKKMNQQRFTAIHIYRKNKERNLYILFCALCQNNQYK